jgi:hypothetical protein
MFELQLRLPFSYAGSKNVKTLGLLHNVLYGHGSLLLKASREFAHDTLVLSTALTPSLVGCTTSNQMHSG